MVQIQPTGSQGITTIDEHEALTFGPNQSAAAPVLPAKPVLQDLPTTRDYLRRLVDRRK